MTNVHKSKAEGGNLTPPLRQTSAKLALAADPRPPIPAAPAPPSPKSNKITSACTSIQNAANAKLPVGSCSQVLWFSFFFDGTGNNLDADLDLKKHSNVAKLYRAHRGDENIGGATNGIRDGSVGIYRFYVPGLGTYFREIGDEAIGYGQKAGLVVGWNGDSRLAWALRQFDKKMAYALQLAKDGKNNIVEVNISAFGFSRGAALARAFIHDFVKDRCKDSGSDIWILKNGGCRIRIRFMGLFDTVASAGSPMSGNTMHILNSTDGSVVQRDKRFKDYKETIPTALAFAPKAAPGADPAPGPANGHVGWGDRMMIPEMVEEVRHFVAGHEVHNSFPLDSIQVLQKNGAWRKPKNIFLEYVYAGVHSDVGGSYKPGEGGKNEEIGTKLGLIPLRAMYDFAHASGVPFHPESAWKQFNVTDFQIREKVTDDYKNYLKNIKPVSQTLGAIFNEHMRLYYAWRFYVINRKLQKDQREADRIQKNEVLFNEEFKELEAKTKAAKDIYDAVAAKLKSAINIRESEKNGFHDRGSKKPVADAMDADIEKLEKETRAAKDEYLKCNAKISALPSMGKLPSLVDFFDQQLYDDAKAIYAILESPRLNTIARKFETVSDNLRPHYKVMMQAYHNEFKSNKGLRDEKIISFFEEYVHDSVAGFGADATLRSDPRVIYVGEDNKLAYADAQPANGKNSSDNVA